MPSPTRTWCGTVQALTLLRDCEAADTESKARKVVSGCIEKVARQLGNTKAVCRKSYVHPAVIDAYLDGSIARRAGRAVKAIGNLTAAEGAVLALLRQRQ